MTSAEAKRKLLNAGFTLWRSSATSDIYEFDEDIRVAIAKRSKENPHTTREVEMNIRRAENRRRDHEKQNKAVLSAPMREVMIQRPKVQPTVAAPPPPPPAPPVEEEEETGDGISRRKFPEKERFAMMRRIVGLHDGDGKAFYDIAEIFKSEGLKTPSGHEISPTACKGFYERFFELREYLNMPKASVEKSLVPQASLPAYLAPLLDDPNFTIEKKLQVLRALHGQLPASVEMVLEDEKVKPAKRLAILAVALDDKI